jgi:hypothetical protein
MTMTVIFMLCFADQLWTFIDPSDLIGRRVDPAVGKPLSSIARAGALKRKTITSSETREGCRWQKLVGWIAT